MKVQVEDKMVRSPLYIKRYTMDGVTDNDMAVMFLRIYEKQFGKNLNDPNGTFSYNVRQAMQDQLDHQNYDWVNDPEGRLNYEG